jgi:hypothetical protein
MVSAIAAIKAWDIDKAFIIVGANTRIINERTVKDTEIDMKRCNKFFMITS